MSIPKLTFYDLMSKAEDLSSRPSSPNTWKIRYALNIKKIPYETVWLETADVNPTMKQLGVPPTAVRGGRPFYSVPTIYDPSTQKAVTDTIHILIYLEEQYPEHTPLLFPKATRPLQTAFTDTFFANLSAHMIPIMLFGVYDRLSPRSQAYFRESREQWFGKRLEDVVLEGEARERAIGEVVAALGAVGKWMDMNGEGSMQMTGESISFSDVGIAAVLTAIKR
ncbi:hypothetical protein OF83DRAFT_1173644, partial [Amylostereum chailletii]